MIASGKTQAQIIKLFRYFIALLPELVNQFVYFLNEENEKCMESIILQDVRVMPTPMCNHTGLPLKTKYAGIENAMMKRVPNGFVGDKAKTCQYLSKLLIHIIKSLCVEFRKDPELEMECRNIIEEQLSGKMNTPEFTNRTSMPGRYFKSNENYFTTFENMYNAYKRTECRSPSNEVVSDFHYHYHNTESDANNHSKRRFYEYWRGMFKSYIPPKLFIRPCLRQSRV